MKTTSREHSNFDDYQNHKNAYNTIRISVVYSKLSQSLILRLLSLCVNVDLKNQRSLTSYVRRSYDEFVLRHVPPKIHILEHFRMDEKTGHSFRCWIDLLNVALIYSY